MEPPPRVANELVLYEWRPLHWAIWTKESAIVDLLLEHNADVNATLRAGVTPLHVAAHHDDPDLLKRLIDRGADLASATETTTVGANPYNQPADTVINGGVTALHIAVGSRHLTGIKLLLDVGAPIDAVTESERMTPLFIATSLSVDRNEKWNNLLRHRRPAEWRDLVLEQMPGLVRTLLEGGASPNIAASDGTTPLHNVCGLGLQELAMLLLENGALIDPRTEIGYTPLMMAAMSNVPVDLLIALVEKGASLEAQKNGWSALQFADPAARVPLMRRYRYPEWVKDENVRLCFPQILDAHELVVRKAEDEQPPPSMADLLLEWTELHEVKSTQFQSERPIGSYPMWSEARLYRRTPEGVEVIQLDLKLGELPPELQWGDVVEVTTASWEGVSSLPKGEAGLQVTWEMPDSFRTVLEAAQVRQVTVTMSGIEKQLTLRGRLHIYNPLTDEAPLLPLGPLIRLLGGGSGEYSNAGLAVHRRPEQGDADFTTRLGLSEAEELVLMDGDRIEVTPLPSSSKEKELRISMVSPGLLFGRSYPSAAHDSTEVHAALVQASWEGYGAPPTLLQFLAWHQASFALWDLWESETPRDEARKALQEWLADPDALAEAIIRSATVEPRGILPYPDWSKLVIRRLNDNLWQETIPVDLAAAMRACNESTTEEEARAFDIQLQFGDLVELPVLEERPDEPWTGFHRAAICLFEKALARSVSYQERDGDFRGVKLRWIPPVYIPTSAGLVPLPAEFPELGRVTVPLAYDLVQSEGGLNYSVEEVMRVNEPVPARAFTWLQNGDRVIAVRPPQQKSRVIYPPDLNRSRPIRAR